MFEGKISLIKLNGKIVNKEDVIWTGKERLYRTF